MAVFEATHHLVIVWLPGCGAAESLDKSQIEHRGHIWMFAVRRFTSINYGCRSRRLSGGIWRRFNSLASSLQLRHFRPSRSEFRAKMKFLTWSIDRPQMKPILRGAHSCLTIASGMRWRSGEERHVIDISTVEICNCSGRTKPYHMDGGIAKGGRNLIVKYWAHKKRLVQLAKRFVEVKEPQGSLSTNWQRC